MTDQERAQLQLRLQNKKSRVQGAFFEQIISAGCDHYRNTGIADIEKTPEPMKPVKSIGGGKFIAVYTGEAQADYKGFLNGGRAVYFEAKYTDTGKMMQNRVTQNQAKRLERAYRMGAISFVLCSFGSVGFYRIPWKVWRDMDGHFGHKFATPKDAAPYEVHIGGRGPGALLFLGELETLRTNENIE